MGWHLSVPIGRAWKDWLRNEFFSNGIRASSHGYELVPWIVYKQDWLDKSSKVLGLEKELTVGPTFHRNSTIIRQMIVDGNLNDISAKSLQPRSGIDSIEQLGFGNINPSALIEWSVTLRVFGGECLVGNGFVISVDARSASFPIRESGPAVFKHRAWTLASHAGVLRDKTPFCLPKSLLHSEKVLNVAYLCSFIWIWKRFEKEKK